MNYFYFNKIISHLINNSNYPNNIYARYINFNINPLLRINLAYYNYMNQYTIKNNELGVNNYINNAYLFEKFTNFVKYIKKQDSIPIYKSHKNKLCCKCCKCLSKSKIQYTEFKYLPYLNKEDIKLLTDNDDIWYPRY